MKTASSIEKFCRRQYRQDSLSNFVLRWEAPPWENGRNVSQVLQPVEEEAGVGNVPAARETSVGNRTQKKVTDYFAEKEEDLDRRNDIGIEHHTMSEGDTEDVYEDSLTYKTASTKILNVLGTQENLQTGRLHGRDTRPRGIRRFPTGSMEREGNGGPGDRNPRNIGQRPR